MRRRAFFAAGLLIVFAIALLHAQEPRVAGNTFVFSLNDDAEQSGAVARVVSSSVELHLGREGILVLPGVEPAADQELSPALRAQAEEAGTPWVLQASLDQENQQVTVLLQLFDARDGNLAASVQATEPVGLTIDRAIADLTAELIDAAGDRLATTAPDGPGGPVEPALPPRVTAPRETPPAQPTPGRTTAAVIPPPDNTLALGVRYAPFVPVAGITQYMDISLTGVSALVALLPFETDLFAVGLGFDGLLSEATGFSATATLQTASLSLVARFAGVTGSFSPFVAVGGGASLILADNALLGTFFGVAPYGMAELGVDLLIYGGLSVQFAVDFSLIFEQSIWIMGFSPGIGLEMRI